MKRFLLLPIFVMVLFAVPATAQAKGNFASGEQVVVAANETIEGDYFAAGKRVAVDGIVDGDVYAAGSEVTINGTVYGDVLAAGETITINGEVRGDVRAGGRSITAAPAAEILGSVTLGGESVSLLGAVGRGVVAGGRYVTIGNGVGGNVTAGAERLVFSPTADIAGTVTYWSEVEASMQKGAMVAGEVTHYTPPKSDRKAAERMSKQAAAGLVTGWSILSFLTALMTGWLFIKLVPVFFERVEETLTTKALPSLGVGFLAIAATPVAIVLLLMTLVGVPLAVLWLIGLAVGLCLAKIFVGMAVGAAIGKGLKLRWSRYWLFAVGLVIYSVVAMVPVVGWLVGFVVSLAALGALILTKKGYYAELRQKKLI